MPGEEEEEEEGGGRGAGEAANVTLRRAAPPPAPPGACGRPGSTPSARVGAGSGAAGAVGQRSLPWREPRAGLRSPPAPPLSRHWGKRRRRKAPSSPPRAGPRQEECAWGRVLPPPQASLSLCPGGAGKGPRWAASASRRGRDPAPAVAAEPSRAAAPGAARNRPRVVGCTWGIRVVRHNSVVLG